MLNENVTQVHHTSKDELIHNILQGVEKKLNEFEKKFQPKEPTQWLTKKEVAAILSVSLVTIDSWGKKGVLSPFRVGNMIRFDRKQVEQSLTQINNEL